MKPKKVCACGHFAFGKSFFDGQTVKTKMITAELEKRFGPESVRKLDTHGGLKVWPGLALRLFGAAATCQNIVIFPAQNGVRVLVPLLRLVNLFWRRRLHYVVIGGWLPEFIENKKFLTKQLRKLDGIYVETGTMQKALEKQGFQNVKVLPNCKNLTTLSEGDLVYAASMPYQLCTFSRVLREKGIEDAVFAVRAVNERFGKTVYELDIYGQIDPGQAEWFDGLRKTFPPYIRYKNTVPYDQSVEVLKNYFALLFLTYCEGEGFAGTLLDAFASGVPVVASDWRFNPEIVEDGVTGALCPARDLGALCELLSQIAENPRDWEAKKRACLAAAHRYRPDAVVQILVDNLA